MGFEIERFIDDVDEEFICLICSGVLEDPLQAPDCEHAFCRACITEWISRQPTCPVDRQPVTASQLRPAPRFMRNLLSRLCTSCDYAPHGCNAVLKLESLASHVVECEFNPKRPVPCEAGCGLVILKGELAKHNCVRELRALIATHQEKLNVYEQELAENKRVHQEKLNDYKRELAENKRVHQEKLNDYKRELAENKRVHQEKLNDYKRELAENTRVHQEKLNDYEQELAEHKRAHQEKLNDYEQELAELKRELAELKESKQEMRLLNPSTRELAEERERDPLVRWSNTLERARVTRWYTKLSAPGNDVTMRIKGSLSKSGCPPHIIDDLMKNSEVGRWPPLIRSSYEGGTLPVSELNKYVCKRVPGQQAVLFLHCDNTHVDQQRMMVKPGFIVFFLSGIVSYSQTCGLRV